MPTGEQGEWAFGHGAAYYVNATQAPYSTNYNTYDYVNVELPDLLKQELNLNTDKMSIFGHSVGGHGMLKTILIICILVISGALISYLKQPNRYKSCSAFAPMCNPCKNTWGTKAFSRFFGADAQKEWEQYDTSHLAKNYKLEPQHVPILIDQGTADKFLPELMPDALIEAANQSGLKLHFRKQEGFDHGYWFITTFIEDHMEFHAQHLQ